MLYLVYFFVLSEKQKKHSMCDLSMKKIKKCPEQVKSAIANRTPKNCPYARTSARTVQNPFRTHFRTHIARAEVR